MAAALSDLDGFWGSQMCGMIGCEGDIVTCHFVTYKLRQHFKDEGGGISSLFTIGACISKCVVTAKHGNLGMNRACDKYHSCSESRFRSAFS